MVSSPSPFSSTWKLIYSMHFYYIVMKSKVNFHKRFTNIDSLWGTALKTNFLHQLFYPLRTKDFKFCIWENVEGEFILKHTSYLPVQWLIILSLSRHNSPWCHAKCFTKAAWSASCRTKIRKAVCRVLSNSLQMQENLLQFGFYCCNL